MTHIFDSQFIPVSIPIILRITGAIPFDIYIRRSADQYTKLFPKNEPIEAQRAQSYFAKGVTSLFVQSIDYRQYLLFVESRAAQLLNDHAPASDQELTDVVREMTNLSMYDILHQLKIDQTSIENAAQTIHGCVELLGKDPKALIRVLKGLTHHPYLIRHSIYTAVFALLLGKADELTSDKSFAIVGLGGFLHDIGMSQISFDAEQKEELTPEEWKEMRLHPELGKRLTDNLKMVSPEVRTVIMQHHEQPNGMGYPNSLRGGEIYYPAKIVSIADSFCALISARPFRAPFSPLEALAIMKEDRGKFDATLLKKFAGLFVHLQEEKK